MIASCLFALLLVGLASVLGGCGGGDAPSSTPTPAPPVGPSRMADGLSIPLDAKQYQGGPRLLVTVSAQDEDGKDLTPHKLLLDTGSSTLAFCDTDLEERVQEFETKYYSCNTYGVGKEDASGYWGHFYRGAVHSPDTDFHVSQGYYSVMHQQFGMPCTKGFEGIFGIAFRSDNEATTEKPSDWSSTRVGSCPDFETNFVQPLMQYLNDIQSKGGQKQLGIYWSGKSGDGEGRLFLGSTATDNPNFKEDVAAQIGRAKLDTSGNYNINIQSIDYGGQRFDVTCVKEGQYQCNLDTGTPTLMLPRAVYDVVMTSKIGDISINLEGSEGGTVTLKFDVARLIENEWIEPNDPGSSLTMLGLPLRAFYYTVMDIADKSLAFSPMTDYFQEQTNATTVTV